MDYKLSHLVINNNLTVNETFDQFAAIFAETVNQFFPTSKVSRKRIWQKSWLTGSLLKSIRTKNKMYSRLHKTTENLELTEEFKTYRNTLNCILCLAKRNYYHQVLNANKGDSKKVWNIVNELTYNKKRSNVGQLRVTTAAGDTVSDPQKIAEECNNFLVNIGRSMADSISLDSSFIPQHLPNAQIILFSYLHPVR